MIPGNPGGNPRPGEWVLYCDAVDHGISARRHRSVAHWRLPAIVIQSYT